MKNIYSIISVLHAKMKASTTIFSLVSSLALVSAYTTPPAAAVKAVVVLNGEKVKGTVSLSQEVAGGPTTLSYNITGLDASAERGFHIHASGDLSGGCASAGAHYNPAGKDHGAPTDAIRHVGDLGNIKSDANGAAYGTITDAQVQLSGPTSVLGRAIVVHGGTDDLGKGASADSKKTGNAGGRSACGVIGVK